MSGRGEEGRERRLCAHLRMRLSIRALAARATSVTSSLTTVRAIMYGVSGTGRYA